jgi:hypothetical protein
VVVRLRVRLDVPDCRWEYVEDRVPASERALVGVRTDRELVRDRRDGVVTRGETPVEPRELRTLGTETVPRLEVRGAVRLTVEDREPTRGTVTERLGRVLRTEPELREGARYVGRLVDGRYEPLLREGEGREYDRDGRETDREDRAPDDREIEPRETDREDRAPDDREIEPRETDLPPPLTPPARPIDGRPAPGRSLTATSENAVSPATTILWIPTSPPRAPPLR